YDGIAELHAAFERDIRSSTAHTPPGAAAGGWGGLWRIGRRLGRSGPAEGPRASEAGVDWLSSSKEAISDLLHKAFPEIQPEASTFPPEPSETRRLSLAVPVTASKEVSMDSGRAWWSKWLAEAGQEAAKAEDPNLPKPGAS